MYSILLIIFSFLQAGCFLNARLSSADEAALQSTSDSVLSYTFTSTGDKTASFGVVETVRFYFTNTGSESISSVSMTPLPSGWIALSNTCITVAIQSTCGIEYSAPIPLTDTTYSLNFLVSGSSGKTQNQLTEIKLAPTFPGVATVAKVYPTNGNSWNDYIARSNLAKDENSQADSACVITGLNTFRSCFHAGEKLKVTTTLTTCSNLSAVDLLDAFLWTCDASSGKAIFYSNQLKLGKYLSHLLNPTEWKQNKVTIKHSGNEIMISPLERWWNNPVLDLPDASSTGISVSTSGAIYTFATNRNSRGITLTESKIAIVGLNNSTITYVAGVGSLIMGSANSLHHIWLEGNLTGGTSIGFARYLYVSRLQNMNISKGIYGVKSAMGSGIVGSTFNDVRISHMTSGGLDVEVDFTGNLVYRSVFSNIGIYCLDTWSSTHSKFIEVQCLNSAYGVHHKYGGDFIATSAINNNSSAIYQDYAQPGEIFHNILSLKNLYGLNLARLSHDTAILYSNIASVGNGTFDVQASTSFSPTKKNMFTNHLIIGAAGCEIGSSTAISTGLVDSTCTTTGANLSQSYGAGLESNAVLHTGVGITDVIIGQTLDVLNSNGGILATAFASILDWFRFDNTFRTWSREPSGGTNLAHLPIGACTSGNCSVVDFRLSVTSPFFNATGDGTAGSSPVLVAGSACPSIAHGNIVTYTLEATPRPFLTNAYEIPISPAGNHDGLCESGEFCVYTPHFGAYQGQGDYWSNSCTFQNGVVSDVRLFGYSSN